MVQFLKIAAAAAVAVFVITGSPNEVSASTLKFTMIATGATTADTDVVLEDITGGVKFSYTVNDATNTGTPLAVYFNLGNGLSFSDLSIAGSAVTGTAGPSRNIQGGNIGEFYDVGVAIGDGSSSFFSAFMFTVMGVGVDVTDFTGEKFASYLHNVAPTNDPQASVGRAKVYATAPPIPLPAAGWMLIAGLGGLVALRRRKSKS